jgi:hypothetical protein
MRLSAGIEVAAASGAAVLLAGLWWANQFETRPFRSTSAWRPVQWYR